jgi:hypothetical protein
MNKAEPTAGEWKASGLGVYSVTADGIFIGGIGRADREDAISYAEACRNADLFAASKDLLAACERAYAFHDDLCADSDISVQLRAAIAKAKGES